MTSTLVFEGDGRVAEYSWRLRDWQRVKALQRAAAAEAGRAPTPAILRKPASNAKPGATLKLSFKERREFEALPSGSPRSKKKTRGCRPRSCIQSSTRRARWRSRRRWPVSSRCGASCTPGSARWDELDSRGR